MDWGEPSPTRGEASVQVRSVGDLRTARSTPEVAVISMTSSSPEARLIERIEAGDRQAEELLVERFGRGVALVLDRHSSWRGEVDDLFQETFRVAIEKLRRGELRDPEKLGAFLAQIARYLSLDAARKQIRRKTEPDAERVEREIAPRGNPLSELLERENTRLVRRVLAELDNDRDREVLFRFYLAEEDRREIARDLGLDNLQLNRVLYRARKRYQTLYQERLSGSRPMPPAPHESRSHRTLLLGLVSLLATLAQVVQPW